jgi:exodeoxyribonuclease-3
MKLRLATWNINSVRLRQEQVQRFVEDYKPDILCLQETKCMDDQFPQCDWAERGYEHVVLNGQKAYHGVAILSRLPVQDVSKAELGGKPEARHVSIRLPDLKVAGKSLTVHNFYVPAGGDIPNADENPKFQHKLDYLTDMANWFASDHDASEPMIMVGDLNVAPLENDVWSHKQMLKVVSHTPVEVDHLEKVQASIGWVDAMRCHVPAEEKLFTWWSYRAKDWKASNRGRRLDHVWHTPVLEGSSSKMEVVDAARSWERPSDHAPVLVEFDLKSVCD